MTGGLAVTILGLYHVGVASPGYSSSVLGGLQALIDGSPEKFEMVQSWNHPELPWIGVFFGGMWLANIFYWGCNQFITQKTLAARDIWHGQMGVMIAGYLKLFVPILVVLPGIIAFRLYDPQVGLLNEEFTLLRPDLAFPTLVKAVLPAGISGLVMAGLMGAVMSTIAALLTSSSQIFTYDIYQRYVKSDAQSKDLVLVGRIITLTVLVVATGFGFLLTDLEAIFTYIQRYWSIAWPAVVAVFLAGFFYKRATARGSIIALITGPVWAILWTLADTYGLVPHLAFLNRAALDFIFCCLLIWIFRADPGDIPAKAHIDRSLLPEDQALVASMPWYKRFSTWSALLIFLIILLYIRFF